MNHFEAMRRAFVEIQIDTVVHPENWNGYKSCFDRPDIYELWDSLARQEKTNAVNRRPKTEHSATECEIRYVVENVLGNNQDIVVSYRGGKKSAINALIGKVIRSVPKANSAMVKNVLLSIID